MHDITARKQAENALQLLNTEIYYVLERTAKIAEMIVPHTASLALESSYAGAPR